MSDEQGQYLREQGDYNAACGREDNPELAAARKDSAKKDAEIARLKEALRDTLRIHEAFILCPICTGADGNHGMSCNVPKWKALAAEALAEKEVK